MNKVALFAIIGTAMFLLGGGTAFAATPSSTPVHIQPNPTVNVNVTWSSFNSSWGELEYNNGSANLTLNAQPSTTYRNPISVNPLDIQSNQLYNTSSGYNNLSNWGTASSGTFASPITQHIATSTTINGHKAIMFQENATGTGATQWVPTFSIPFAKYPSNNIAYDYLTVIANESSQFTASGQSLYISIENMTDSNVADNAYINITGNKLSTASPTSIYPGGLIEFSAPLNQISGLNFNASQSDGLTVRLVMTTPDVQTSTYQTVTIDSIQLTENQLYLGTTQTNTTQEALADFTGNAQLTSFNPNFAWSAVNNNGYTVSVSQTIQNLTTTQTPISSGNYIEQVEYQGLFDLPTAPDLSYGPANLTEAFNLSTSQTQVLDINGVSYLSEISGKNGTIQLLASVNPNQPTQFLQIVDYTQSQWNSISVAPGIFTIAGIEYYWWIAVGGLATLIGLAAAAKHAGTKADQERIRRGR